MIILGIESSCDDTAICLLNDGKEILAEKKNDQNALHAAFGGIVPEVAARRHLEVLNVLLRDALIEANLSFEDIDLIAVTHAPGLIGSLAVGVSAAKALSLSLGIPLVGVHHIEGHLLSTLYHHEVEFPALGLVVSGGNTDLYLVEGFGRYELLGQTRDDAVGECLDKIAKHFGLGYPGGPILEKLAGDIREDRYRFTRPMLGTPDLDFSYSGLKTAVIYHFRDLGRPPTDAELPHFAYSVQAAAYEVLVRKTLRAAKEHSTSRVLVSGGVAASKLLREMMCADHKQGTLEPYFPPLKHCTDNALMIAYTGWHLFNRGVTHGQELEAAASLPV